MRKLSLIAVLLFATVSARADVTLHGIFGDNMVLQRAAPVPVYGTAEPGEMITVTFAGQTKSAKADKDGKWNVKLSALKASMTSAAMTVKGKNKVTINNIVVGDVWVCSGQSNMERKLGECNRPEDIKTANFPLIRQYAFPQSQSSSPADVIKGSWSVCSPDTANSFTAVGFYFGRKIRQEAGIPIGLIKAAWNGTAIEPWISPDSFAAIPEKMRAGVNNSYAPSPWHCLYNGMIHPLINFPIKGVIWYQGESNALFAPNDANKVESYSFKMSALIAGWRKAWNLGDFPFYFVQLANYQNPNNNPEGGDSWAQVCMAQLKTLSITNTGMAVAIDLANADNPGDIHPRNKKDVGERLALWSLARDYGKKKLVYSGPLYKTMKVEGDKIRISFDCTGAGLMIAKKKGYDPAVKDPKGKLQRFAIAGENKKWVWANAVIEPSTGSGQVADTVVVSSPEVPKPVAVRYAYSQNPDGCNLYNNEGLPASPFRTDEW